MILFQSERMYIVLLLSSSTGLCYQGFLEAFFLISKKKFPSENQLSSAKSFLEHCESHIEGSEVRPYRSYLPRLDRVELLEKRTAELKQASETNAQIQKMNSYFMTFRSHTTPVSERPTNLKGRKKNSLLSDKEWRPKPSFTLDGGGDADQAQLVSTGPTLAEKGVISTSELLEVTSETWQKSFKLARVKCRNRPLFPSIDKGGLKNCILSPRSDAEE